ncbi:MAG: type VI secretion system tip protein TssI/VgrG [Minicystis sp.]
MIDLITFASSALSGKVVGFRGTEAMSRPYHFEIFVQMMGEFDLKSAIGAKATMVVDRATEGFVPFCFAGVLANVEVVHAYDGQVLVRAHLVPKLWQAGLSRHSRIFTNMRIPDIITQVLGENGVSEYELRLGGSYDAEEHVCQFRESDLDFISRWMEKEGIFYFFEHGPDGEKLVLADGTSYDQDPLGVPVPYAPQLGHDHMAGPHFRAFSGKQSTLPTQARLADYDYLKPNLQLTGSAPVQANGAGQVVLYGERFFTPPSAQKYARLHAEELLAREAVYKGVGTRLHLRPGYAFDLEGHPFGSFNTRYLTIEATHSANQAGGHSAFREVMGILHDDVYRVEVEAIPAQTQFRPEKRTAWPRVYGYENGVIDGAGSSPYAQLDDQGRYKVKFKFDESALRSGQASTWVRMMQPHGGDVEGFHFPLRKDTEVVIGFLDGDVDRPVIFGTVPSAVKPSPVTTSNHTRNVVQTGGRNRLEFEDQSGSQWVHLSTPSAKTHLFLGATGDEGDHNFVLETQGTGHLHTGSDWDVDVGAKLTETVTGDVTETYESNTSQIVFGDKTHMVQGSQEETVMSGFTQTIMAFSRRTILGPYTQLHMGPHTHVHKGPHAHTHVGPLVHTHEGPHTHSQVGPHLHTHTGPLTRQRTGTTKETLNGDVSRQITGDVGETVSGKVDWTVGGNVHISCNTWKVEARNDVLFSFLTNTFKHTAGISTEVFGGLKNEFIGGEKGEFVLGAKTSVVAGAKVDWVMAARSSWTIGPESKASPIELAKAGFHEMEDLYLKLETGVFNMCGLTANFINGFTTFE